MGFNSGFKGLKCHAYSKCSVGLSLNLTKQRSAEMHSRAYRISQKRKIIINRDKSTLIKQYLKL